MPLDYVNKLETKQHIMLLYEDPDYARLIQFQFVRNGLKNSEHVIFMTDNISQIISKMVHYGIPVEDSIRKNLLHFINSKICDDNGDVMIGCQKTMQKVLRDTRVPRRMVGRFVPDVSSVSGICDEIELEKYGHKNFDNFGGSIMCTYDVSEIEPRNKNRWIEKLYENHHVVICLKKFGQGTVNIPQ